jgi:hypothetical protein
MRRSSLFHGPVLVFLILSLGFQTVAFGQDRPIMDFDNYGNLCWEDEVAVLNSFASKLLADKTLIAYVVIYAGRQSCPGEAKYRGERAKKYLVKKGVEAKRVVVMDGGYRIELTWYVHMLPKDGPPYEPDLTLDQSDVSVRRRCVDKIFARVLCLDRK